MNLLFYLFASLALISGLMVIQARNPVHSVLFLILVFFNAAGLLILLGLDFFGMVFLVVYVGAIAVLFLFVVMMLNIRLEEINEKKLRYLPVGGLVGFLFLLETFLIIDNDLIPLISYQKEMGVHWSEWSGFEGYTNIETLGSIIYTYYYFFFMMASIILLVAMIGAILLTMHKRVDVKRQELFRQNSREFGKTVSKVSSPFNPLSSQSKPFKPRPAI